MVELIGFDCWMNFLEFLKWNDVLDRKNWVSIECFYFYFIKKSYIFCYLGKKWGDFFVIKVV